MVMVCLLFGLMEHLDMKEMQNMMKAACAKKGLEYKEDGIFNVCVGEGIKIRVFCSRDTEYWGWRCVT